MLTVGGKQSIVIKSGITGLIWLTIIWTFDYKSEKITTMAITDRAIPIESNYYS